MAYHQQRFLEQAIQHMTNVGQELLNSIGAVPYYLGHASAPPSAILAGHSPSYATRVAHTEQSGVHVAHCHRVSDLKAAPAIPSPPPSPSPSPPLLQLTSAMINGHDDNDNGYSGDAVDLVVVSPTVSDEPMPTVAPVVQNAAGSPKNDFIISTPLCHSLDPTSIATTTMASASTNVPTIPTNYVLVTKDWRIVHQPNVANMSAAAKERRRVASSLRGNKPAIERQLATILEPEDYIHVVDPFGDKHFITDIGVPPALLEKSLFFEPTLAMLKRKTDGPEWVIELLERIPKGPKGKEKFLAQHPTEFWPTILFKVKPRRPSQKRVRDAETDGLGMDSDGDDDDDSDNGNVINNGNGAAPDAMDTDGSLPRAASLIGSNDEMAPPVLATATGQSASPSSAFTREELDLVLGLNQQGLKAQDAWRVYSRDYLRLRSQVDTMHITAPSPLPATTTTTNHGVSGAVVAAAATATATPLSPVKLTPAKVLTPKPLATKSMAKPLAKPSAVPRTTRVVPTVQATDWFSTAFQVVANVYRAQKQFQLEPYMARSKKLAPETWEQNITDVSAYKAHPHFIKFILPITAVVYQRYVHALDNGGVGASELPVPENKPFCRDWFDLALRFVLRARNDKNPAVIEKLVNEAHRTNPLLFESFGGRTFKDFSQDSANKLFKDECYTSFIVPITAMVFERCVLPLTL